MIPTPEQGQQPIFQEAKDEKEWNKFYQEARSLVEQLRQRLEAGGVYKVMKYIVQQMLEIGYTEEQLRQCAVYHALIGSTVKFGEAPYLDVAGEKMMKSLREAVMRMNESS